MAAGHDPQVQQVLRDFAGRLKKLQARAGNPSTPQLVKASGAALNTSGLSELLEGKAGVFRIPPWERIAAFVEACKAHSAKDGFPLDPPLGDLHHWRTAHGDLVEKVDELAGAGTGVSAGGGGAPSDGAGAGGANGAGGGTLPGPAILGGTVHVTLPQGVPVAAGLVALAPPRAVPAWFTGRDEDLEDLLAALNPAADTDAGAEAVVVLGTHTIR